MPPCAPRTSSLCLSYVYHSVSAHHALISAQYTKPMDRWRIELHTVCIPTSVLRAFSTRPLSDLMISALPFSLLSTIHCTVLHSASDTVWYTEKPGFSIPHVFIYRGRLIGWLINIAHLGILCDHVPDLNIDFSSYFYGIIYRRIFIPTRLVRCRKAE